MRIVIAGGTGLIGRALVTELSQAGYETVVLSRQPQQVSMPERVQVMAWDGQSGQGWSQVLDGDTVIINLAGEPIAGKGFFPARWTAERKQRINESRQHATHAVIDAIQSSISQTGSRPRAVIQASAVGFYGPLDIPRVQEDHPVGKDFLAEVCMNWENAAAPLEGMGVRLAIARIGVVLAPGKGALLRQSALFRLYLGGPIGSGEQGYPWIHIRDVASALRFLAETPTTHGPFNLTAPDIVTNAEFGKALAEILGRPYWLPTPAFLLRMAFGEVSSLLIEGQKAYPKRLLAAGYPFRYPQLAAALKDLFASY